MDSKRNTGKEKNMIGFEKFMNLMAQKKCPPGFRFDEKLKGWKSKQLTTVLVKAIQELSAKVEALENA